MFRCISHLELEIDERDLFYRRERDDGEQQERVNAPADNRFLSAAPHIETTFSYQDVR